MVIWLTGLSGAGKTTIANEVVRLIKPSLSCLVQIDGDVIRELFGAGLGFNIEARTIQIERIQRLALFLSRQDIPLIVSALYSNHELMRWNRTFLPNYYEVYVDTPLATVEERDTKGIYSKARAGSFPNVVGLDIPWEAPQNPDLTVNTVGTTPAEVASQIIEALPKFRSA
jgi:adenylylsulfate kinase-like enzyme